MDGIDLNGLGIFQSTYIKSSLLEFSDEVRKMCKDNYCGRYGKSWMCPPGVGEVELLKQKCLRYSDGFLFTTKSDLEDSYDFEGMTAAMLAHNEITKKIREQFRKKYGEVLALSAGSCSICGECTYPDSPCRSPENAVPSIEAAGINVVTLSRAANINYINGKDTVTYFGLILFNPSEISE